MARDSISIIMPVGPQPEYKKYLGECLDSIAEQLREDDEIWLIDDMAGLSLDRLLLYSDEPINIFHCPWLVGCSDAWNFGVSLATNDLCLLMGSDDRLYPDCLDELRDAYASHNYMDAWYNLTVHMQSGSIYTWFNNAAAVTRSLWKRLGGFPPSAGVGAPDALLISIMMVHMPECLIKVKEGTPLYWVREGDHTDTQRQAGLFSGEVISIRDKETRRFVPYPAWSSDEK